MDRRTLLRWTWRDLRARWLLVPAIGLTIALGTGAYAGLTSTTAWARMSYDDSFALTAMHDLRVQLPTGSVAPAGSLRDAVLAGDAGAQIVRAEERLVLPTSVDASTGDATVLVPGRIVGLPVAGGGPAIDRLWVTAGRSLAATDAGRAVALLEHKFADHYALPVVGHITVRGGHELELVGRALSPEYFVVTTEAGGLLAEAGFAVVFVPLETAQAIAGGPLVNGLVIDLVPGADVETARAAVESSLAERLPEIAAEVTTMAEDDAHRVLYDDIESDRVFFDVFATLLLAGAAVAAFNLTSRIVEAQRREIGIAMALGVSPAVIALRPLLVSAQIALLGVAFGIGVGLAIGAAMHDVFVAFVPLPAWRTPLQPDAFAAAALLGFALPFVATLWPIARAVRVAPIEAIRAGYLAGQEVGRGLRHAGRFARRFGSVGRTISRMPVRNVLRTPRRTTLTAAGIAAAVAVVVATGATIDTLNATIDRGEEELLHGSPRRTTVELQGFLPSDEALATLRSTAVVERAEPGLRLAATASAGDTSIDLVVEMFDLDGGSWSPSIVRGTSAADGSGIILSERAARDLSVEPGDTIELRHPVRSGTSLTYATDPVLVVGIHPNPLRFSAYLDLSVAPEFGLGGLANVAYVVPAPDTTDDEVTRVLFGEPGVASVSAVGALATVFRDLVAEYLDILAIAQLAALALAVAIAFNSSTIGFDERAREHATMVAFGTPVRSILGIAVVEHLLIGVLGTCIGLVAGRLLLQWLFESILPTTFPNIGFTLDLAAVTALAAAGAGVAAVALAPLLGIRKLIRMDVPATLRVVE
jgi:putative ABC transport system permease protein